MFRWRWRRSALAYRALFRTPLLPPMGAVGSLGGWLWGKLLSHDHVQIFGQPPKTRLVLSIQPDEENNAVLSSVSSIFKLFGNSIGQGFFFLRCFFNRQLIVTEKKFNRHCWKLNLVEKFFQFRFHQYWSFLFITYSFSKQMLKGLGWFCSCDLEGYGSFS